MRAEKKLWQRGYGFRDMRADRQTDRRTDTLIAAKLITIMPTVMYCISSGLAGPRTAEEWVTCPWLGTAWPILQLYFGLQLLQR